MAHVTAVAAIELGHPMAVVILVKSGYPRYRHSRTL